MLKPSVRSLSQVRGAALTEWVLLVTSLGVMAAFTSGYIGSSARNALDESSRRLDAASTYGAATLSFEDSCLIGTDASERVEARTDITCYRLRGGDDNFAGEMTSHSIDLITLSGSGRWTRIDTGSGDDHVRSEQSGSIRTRGGNDHIILDTFGSTSSRFSIDPGDGNDLVDIMVAPRPTGASPNVLSSGEGSLTANLSCEDDLIEVDLMAGSRTYLSGSCAIRATTRGLDGARYLNASLPHLTARFDSTELLDLNLDIASADPTGAQGLYLNGWRSGIVSYKADVVDALDLRVVGKDIFSSASLEAEISARSGNVTFEHAGSHLWPVSISYAEDGQVSLIFPDGPDFSEMEPPTLSGHAARLLIDGCFSDVVLHGPEGTTQSLSVSCDSTRQDLSIQDSETPRKLELTRQDQTRTITLGAEGLSVARLIIQN